MSRRHVGTLEVPTHCGGAVCLAYTCDRPKSSLLRYEGHSPRHRRCWNYVPTFQRCDRMVVSFGIQYWLESARQPDLAGPPRTSRVGVNGPFHGSHRVWSKSTLPLYRHLAMILKRTMPLKPEEEARENIDAALEAAGWILQDRTQSTSRPVVALRFASTR